MRAKHSGAVSALPKPVDWLGLLGKRHARDAVSVLLLLLVLLPFLWMVQMAFRPAAEALELSLYFTPTLEAFSGLWQDSFARSFGNSLLVSVLSTGLSMVLGVPAAYALSRWRFGRRRQVALWILCTRMAPHIAFPMRMQRILLSRHDIYLVAGRFQSFLQRHDRGNDPRHVRRKLRDRADDALDQRTDHAHAGEQDLR